VGLDALTVPEVDSSSDEDEHEAKANTVLFQTAEAEEAVNEIISNFSGEQLQIPAAQLQEEEYEEEEELELGDEQLWTHQGQTYFKTTYAGQDDMVFNQGGELIGIFNPELDEITEASWDDE